MANASIVNLLFFSRCPLTGRHGSDWIALALYRIELFAARLCVQQLGTNTGTRKDCAFRCFFTNELWQSRRAVDFRGRIYPLLDTSERSNCEIARSRKHICWSMRPVFEITLGCNSDEKNQARNTFRTWSILSNLFSDRSQLPGRLRFYSVEVPAIAPFSFA